MLDQTYRNIELIVVDDKSTDSTAEIVRLLRMNDDRIVLIQNEVRSGTL